MWMGSIAVVTGALNGQVEDRSSYGSSNYVVTNTPCWLDGTQSTNQRNKISSSRLWMDSP